MDDLKRYLNVALAHTRKVCVDEDPIAHGVVALQSICDAASLTDDLRGVDPGTCDELKSIIFDAAIALSRATERWYPPEYVHLRLSAAAGMLSGYETHLHYDRRLYLLTFLNELRAIYLKREISRRGDPLVRLVTINRASNEERASPLQ